MTKKTYFVHRDAWADDRQSDGLELCLIPEFHDQKIYFYCDEYTLFWSNIEEAGDPAKAQDFYLRGGIEPAKLEQIVQADLLIEIGRASCRERV